jgi:phage/plasmid-like protein (TIGR03299 family)
MSANLDMTTGAAAIAFLGSRNDVWHRQGTEMPADASIDTWATAAGLAWTAHAVPAIAALDGAHFDHIPADKRFHIVEGQRFIVRGDTGHALGYVSDGYQIVQPRDVLDWFARYISVDDRFQLDVAGALDGGRTIWATATFNGPVDIAGDEHRARVLMSTTFDGSGATINQGTMTRVVCQNTIRMAWADKRAVVRTRHSTRFDAARVGKELGAIAQGFANYKAVGDALAGVEMAKEEVSAFFKAALDIPFDAKQEDISSRKLGQFSALSNAYRTTAAEGHTGNAWAALQAITRYVDHDRSTRKDPTGEAQFVSAQFGSGDALKGKAMDLLLPCVRDKELVAA